MYRKIDEEREREREREIERERERERERKLCRICRMRFVKYGKRLIDDF